MSKCCSSFCVVLVLLVLHGAEGKNLLRLIRALPHTTLPTTPPTTRVYADTYCFIYGDFACHNHGRCVDTSSSGGFYCLCEHGYYGKTCDQNATPTTPTPSTTTARIYVDTYCFLYGRSACHGHGRCIDTSSDGGFYCICEPGYHGRTCDQIATPRTTIPTTPPTKSTTTRVYVDTYCFLYGSLACHDHGRCVDTSSDGGFYCICEPGYYGQTCAQQVTTLPPYLTTPYCSVSPGACNYHGKCWDTHDHDYFVCQCDPGYQGRRCADKVH